MASPVPRPDDPQRGPDQDPEFRGRPVRPPSSRPMPPDHYAEHEWESGGIKQLLASDEGFIVGRMGNQALRMKTDGHVITCSPTRGGKGVSCVIPQLLDHPGSAFVIDIKGETVAATARARWLMGQDVVVLDPYRITGGVYGYDSYNPLDDLVPETLTFEDDVRLMAQALLLDPEGRKGTEPIWDNATLNALAGAITFIKTCLPREEQTLRTLDGIFAVDPERRQKIAREIEGTAHLAGRYEERVRDFIDFLTAGAEKTKIPDNTALQSKILLRWVSDMKFDGLLERSSFSFRDLQTRPTTVYLVVPDEYLKGSGNEAWIRLLFNAALYQQRLVTEMGYTSATLPQDMRVLFLIDEFPAFGQLKPVQNGMATVAGRGVTLWLFLQNLSQLDDTYGEHAAKQIIGNASLLQAFNSAEQHELEYLSRVVGEEYFDIESVTVTFNEGEGGGTSQGRSVTISNSESRTDSTSHTSGQSSGETDTEGASESYGETAGTSRSLGRQRGWSEGENDSVSRNRSHGTSQTDGRNSGESVGSGSSYSKNQGQSGKHYLLDYLGWYIPLHEKKNRGESWGTSQNRNYSQGISRSESRSVSDGTGESHGTSRGRSGGVSDTIGDSRSSTVNHGSSRSHARTHSTQESNTSGTSQTSGTSRSEAQSATESANWSRGQGISISVKAEQQRIESPRSLRRSLSGGNQLLQMRGQTAFIAPRLIYFEQAGGVYRFPMMALLSGETSVENLSAIPLTSISLPIGIADNVRPPLLDMFRDILMDQEVILRTYHLLRHLGRTFGADRAIPDIERIAEAGERGPALLERYPVLERYAQLQIVWAGWDRVLPEHEAWLHKIYAGAVQERDKAVTEVLPELVGEFGLAVEAQRMLLDFAREVAEAMERTEQAAAWRNIVRRDQQKSG